MEILQSTETHGEIGDTYSVKIEGTGFSSSLPYKNKFIRIKAKGFCLFNFTEAVL